MKALLTTPLGDNFVLFENSQQIISDGKKHMEVLPHLGPYYIASYSNKFSKHEVEVLDPYVLNLDYEGIKRAVKSVNPSIVGISSATIQYRGCVKTARIIKEVNPDIHVCVGGAHSFIYPLEILESPYIDSVLQGEAEHSFPRFLTSLENGQGFCDIHGLYIKRSGMIIKGPPGDIIRDLDSLPFPDRNKMSLKEYHTPFGKKELFTSLITTRGCPFGCAFCFQLYGRYCRFRSPSNVVEELKECVNLGIHKFTIWDDTFTIDKKRVMEICDKIIQEELDIKWDCQGRVNLFDKEMLKKMHKAGCYKIWYGIESGTQRVLDLMKKGITLEQAREAIIETKKIGIQACASWMIGLPTETVDEINQTIKFACSLKGLYYSKFSAYFPLPNTEFYEMGMKQGLFNDYWREYTKNPADDFKLRVWDYDVPYPVLMEKLNECFRRFYMRPREMLSLISSCETFGDFKEYVKAGLWFFKDSFGGK